MSDQDFRLKHGYTGSMMAYDGIKTWYQERQNNRRNESSISAERERMEREIEARKDAEVIRHQHQVEAESMAHEYAMRRSRAEFEHQEQLARLSRDQARINAELTETIRQMELDAELRLQERECQSAEKIAEINLRAEREKGLATLQWKDARDKEKADAQRRVAEVRDFNNNPIKGYYRGDHDNGVPHGKGVFYYDDNRKYDGAFEMGKFSGTGDWYDENGVLIYSGEWLNGRFNGIGRLKLSSDTVFVGEFRGGRMSVGKYVSDMKDNPSEDSSYISPHMKDSTSEEEYVYTGEISNGLPNGRGKKVWANGDSDEGIFVDGIAEGFLLRHRDGNFFMGKVEGNTPNGSGSMSYSNGEEYEGMWVNGVREGEGILKYPNGDTFRGHFYQDQISGDGVYEKPNGDKYIGQWDFRDGILCLSNGLFYSSNGRTYEGDFRNFIIQGNGKCKFADGSLFIGDYVGQEPNNGILFRSFVFINGVWELTPRVDSTNVGVIAVETTITDGKQTTSKATYPDGAVYSGSWIDGAWRNGKLTLPSGLVYVGSFKNFKRDGYGIADYHSGIRYAGEWKDDLWDGEGELTEANGKSCKSSTGRWLKGKFVGHQDNN